MSATLSDGVVVVLGDPNDPDRPYLDDLQCLADDGGTTSWKMPAGAEVGDSVLVYLTSPISSLVAHAIVLSNPTEMNGAPDREWGEGSFAEVGGFGMIDPPITRDELLESVPLWRWPVQPRSATLPAGESAEQLLTYVENHSIDFKLSRLVGSTFVHDGDFLYQVVKLDDRFLVTRLSIDESVEGTPASVVDTAGSLDEALDALEDRILANHEAVA